MVCFGGISGSFGLAMGILAQLRLAKIRTMARPNSPDMRPKRTKKVWLGILIGQHKVLLPICCSYNENSDNLIFFKIKIQDILNCLLEVTIKTVSIACTWWPMLGLNAFLYILFTRYVLWHVQNEQICFDKNRSLQITLSSAESVFSLLQTLNLNTLRDVKTADAKQTNNRSADYLQRLQMICKTLKPKSRYYWWNSDGSFVIRYT